MFVSTCANVARSFCATTAEKKDEEDDTYKRKNNKIEHISGFMFHSALKVESLDKGKY